MGEYLHILELRAEMNGIDHIIPVARGRLPHLLKKAAEKEYVH